MRSFSSGCCHFRAAKGFGWLVVGVFGGRWVTKSEQSSVHSERTV